MQPLLLLEQQRLPGGVPWEHMVWPTDSRRLTMGCSMRNGRCQGAQAVGRPRERWVAPQFLPADTIKRVETQKGGAGFMLVKSHNSPWMQQGTPAMLPRLQWHLACHQFQAAPECMQVAQGKGPPHTDVSPHLAGSSGPPE